VRGGFAPIDYIGTRWENGTIGENQCVTGFDNIGYVVATSASLFNQLYIQLEASSDTSSIVANAIKDAIEKVLGSVSSDRNDIAPYPNPFYQWEPSTNAIAPLKSISMVDGGEALDNIPLWPLLSPQREVDFVMAYDASADTNYFWPNGTALIATWNRTLYNSRNYSMPNVPDSPNSFVNLGLNSRPTFFGCNASDVTNYDQSKPPAPLIAYIPAYPWSTFANTSTYKLSYEPDESRAHLDNGLRSTTLNDTVSDWPACLACAAIKRSVERSGKSHSKQCQQCYSTWCWDGSKNDSQPAEWNPWLGSIPKFIADLTNQSSITPDTVKPSDNMAAMPTHMPPLAVTALAMVTVLAAML
jgi:lysophospholipase